MTAPTITSEELAAEYGVTPRTVRAWVGRGLPAKKLGKPPRWRIDPQVARPWVAANGSPDVGHRIAGLAQAIEKIAPQRDPNGERRPNLPDISAQGGLTRHIDRLDTILDAFTELLFNAEDFDPRLVSSVKAISTELRRLETHRIEMRKAEDSLMDRADHVRVMGTFARMVVDEIQAWARSTPDAVVDALTKIGTKVQARKVIKALDIALEDKAAELRTRITEAVEHADDIE